MVAQAEPGRLQVPGQIVYGVDGVGAKAAQYVHGQVVVEALPWVLALTQSCKVAHDQATAGGQLSPQGHEYLLQMAGGKDVEKKLGDDDIVGGRWHLQQIGAHVLDTGQQAGGNLLDGPALAGGNGATTVKTGQ